MKKRYICSICKKGHTKLYTVLNDLYCSQCLVNNFYVVDVEDKVEDTVKTVHSTS